MLIDLARNYMTAMLDYNMMKLAPKHGANLLTLKKKLTIKHCHPFWLACMMKLAPNCVNLYTRNWRPAKELPPVRNRK